MIDVLSVVTWSGAMLGSGYLIRCWEDRRRMNRVYARLLAEIREEEQNTIPVAEEPWQDYGDMHQEARA